MNSTINDDGLNGLAGPGLVESAPLDRPMDKEATSFLLQSIG